MALREWPTDPWAEELLLRQIERNRNPVTCGLVWEDKKGVPHRCGLPLPHGNIHVSAAATGGKCICDDPACNAKKYSRKTDNV